MAVGVGRQGDRAVAEPTRDGEERLAPGEHEAGGRVPEIVDAHAGKPDLGEEMAKRGAGGARVERRTACGGRRFLRTMGPKAVEGDRPACVLVANEIRQSERVHQGHLETVEQSLASRLYLRAVPEDEHRPTIAQEPSDERHGLLG